MPSTFVEGRSAEALAKLDTRRYAVRREAPPRSTVSKEIVY